MICWLYACQHQQPQSVHCRLSLCAAVVVYLIPTAACIVHIACVNHNTPTDVACSKIIPYCTLTSHKQKLCCPGWAHWKPIWSCCCSKACEKICPQGILLMPCMVAVSILIDKMSAITMHNMAKPAVAYLGTLLRQVHEAVNKQTSKHKWSTCPAG